MLALARKLPAANASMHAGKWEKKNLQGAELRGKTLGILGLGRIGLEVAKRARGFGLEILGSDPFVSAAVARENRIAETGSCRDRSRSAGAAGDAIGTNAGNISGNDIGATLVFSGD